MSLLRSSSRSSSKDTLSHCSFQDFSTHSVNEDAGIDSLRNELDRRMDHLRSMIQQHATNWKIPLGTVQQEVHEAQMHALTVQNQLSLSATEHMSLKNKIAQTQAAVERLSRDVECVVRDDAVQALTGTVDELHAKLRHAEERIQKLEDAANHDLNLSARYTQLEIWMKSEIRKNLLSAKTFQDNIQQLTSAVQQLQQAMYSVSSLLLFIFRVTT